MAVRSNIFGGRQTALSTMSVLMSSLFIGAPAHSAPAVPWLNSPAAEKATAAPAAARSVHPCGSATLRVAAGAAGAYRGQATQEIRLTNIGTEACHLIGFPNVQLQPEGEAPQSAGASDNAPQLANERIELAPGDEAVMLLGTPGSCEAANNPQRKVSKRLQVALPGGGTKLLDGVHIDTLCGRATVAKFHLVQNDSEVNARLAKLGSSLSHLSGALSAPDEVARGGTLRYTVTLSNPTAVPLSLANCPTYTQAVSSDGKATQNTMRLNCAGAGAQIAAKSSVSFEMQIPVPADAPAGSVKLSWKLENGPGVGKLITVR